MKSALVFVAGTASALLLFSIGGPVRAEEGLASIHDLRPEGGKVCMSEHTHYGSSSGLASQKAAQAAAIDSWAGFVAFEYGDNWAQGRLAGSPNMKCSQSGGGWSCSFEARPCRPGSGSPARRVVKKR